LQRLLRRWGRLLGGLRAATPLEARPSGQGIPAGTHARLDGQVQVAASMDQAADFAVCVGDPDQQPVPATREITQEV
jgi:hypothetical protein